MDYFVVVYENYQEHTQVEFVRAKTWLKAKEEVEKKNSCRMVLNVYAKVWDKISELGKEY